LALSDLRLLLNQPPRKLGGHFFFDTAAPGPARANSPRKHRPWRLAHICSTNNIAAAAIAGAASVAEYCAGARKQIVIMLLAWNGEHAERRLYEERYTQYR
jgi:hypothetical protein